MASSPTHKGLNILPRIAMIWGLFRFMAYLTNPEALGTRDSIYTPTRASIPRRMWAHRAGLTFS